MNLQQAIKSCFNKYVTFSGRAARSEYWFWTLFTFIGALIASFIDGALFAGNTIGSSGNGPIYLIFVLAILLPGLAVSVRRFHDIDRSGWWLLTFLIPLLGIILMLIFFTKKGTTGDNRFGPDPLGGVAAAPAV